MKAGERQAGLLDVRAADRTLEAAGAAQEFERQSERVRSAVEQTGNGDGVRWVFARDLLARGTVQPTGSGDVRVLPQRSTVTDALCISLTSPDGQALIQAAMDEVGEFLTRTYSLCPLGSEGEHLDFDRTIAALLAS